MLHGLSDDEVCPTWRCSLFTILLPELRAWYDTHAVALVRSHLGKVRAACSAYQIAC